jgi:hypothetical protein
MIYFIEAVESGKATGGPDHIKIGFTALDSAKRLAKFQTGNPFPLRVLGTMPGDKQDEDLLHRKFKASRVRGEWFRGDDLLFHYILDNTDEFLPIAYNDMLFGHKLTRSSILHVQELKVLFNWDGLFQEVERRLRAGETKDNGFFRGKVRTLRLLALSLAAALRYPAGRVPPG